MALRQHALAPAIFASCAPPRDQVFPWFLTVLVVVVAMPIHGFRDLRPTLKPVFASYVVGALGTMSIDLISLGSAWERCGAPAWCLARCAGAPLTQRVFLLRKGSSLAGFRWRRWFSRASAIRRPPSLAR